MQNVTKLYNNKPNFYINTSSFIKGIKNINI